MRQIVQYYGVFKVGTSSIALNPEGMALLAGMIIMIIYAMREKAEPDSKGIDYKDYSETGSQESRKISYGFL